MAQYTYYCPIHGQQILDLKMSEVQPKMKCPECNNTIERVFYPINDLWRCSGSYNQTRNNNG
jgi:predicted nucleic acid-binding Zn ribbon protein